MSLDQALRKQQVIQAHRREQQRDVALRQANRKRLVFRINELQVQLDHLEGASAADIVDWLEERRELQNEFAREISDDSVAEDHWSKHFALPEFCLTPVEAVLLRQNAKEKLGDSTLLPGRNEESPNRRRRPLTSPAPGQPRMVTSEGHKLHETQKSIYPKPIQASSAPAGDNMSLAPVKDLNRAALFEIGRNSFRRARRLLDEALSIISSDMGDISADHTAVYAATLNNLGSLLEMCGQSSLAGEYVQRAYELEVKHNSLTVETVLSRASWLALHHRQQEACEILSSTKYLVKTDAHKRVVASIMSKM